MWPIVHDSRQKLSPVWGGSYFAVLSLLGTKLMLNRVRFQFSYTSVWVRLKVKVKETWDYWHLYPCYSLTFTIITLLLLLNTDTVLDLYFCSSKDRHWHKPQTFIPKIKLVRKWGPAKMSSLSKSVLIIPTKTDKLEYTHTHIHTHRKSTSPDPSPCVVLVQLYMRWCFCPCSERTGAKLPLSSQTHNTHNTHTHT